MELSFDYEANRWAHSFHTESVQFPCLAGGLGSGKTFAAIVELLLLAVENPGFTYLIARKTLPSLKDTTFQTFLQAVPPELIKETNKTEMVWTLINGSKFIFRGLDDPEKMKSLEIAGGMVDEANEIDRNMYDILKGRVRQKINGREPTLYRLILSLNPGEETEWIPQLFLYENLPDHKLYTSTTLDNLANLPKTYLTNLQNTYTKDMQQRMIYGLFGKVHKGRPVYPQFQRGDYIHPIEFDPQLPLVRGWDFGYRHPVCIFAQLRRTQLRILAEVLGSDIYLPDFIKDKVFPLQQQLFPDLKIKALDFCDPRGSDESDKGTTSVQILNAHGYFPSYRRTSIEEGLLAINTFMDTKDKQTGEPNYLIHPRCRNLIEGNNGGYHRLPGEEKPNKDNVYDNAQDGKRYLAVHLAQRAKIAYLMKQHHAAVTTVVNPHTGRRVEI